MLKNIAKVSHQILRYVEPGLNLNLAGNSSRNVCFCANSKQLSTNLVCMSFVPIRQEHQQKNVQERNYGKSTKREKEKTLDYYSSDEEIEVLGHRQHRGESKFWRQKMTTFHGILDVNKDGVISYDDFKLLADRFVNLGHLSEKQTQEFRKAIKNLWEMLWGEITPYNLVKVEQYLEDMHHVLNDKSRVGKTHTFLPYLFKAVDKDKSGEITLEEFKLFYKCLGLKDDDAKVAFLSIDSNNNGKITIKEFVSHGRDFFLTEDEERVSKHFWGPLVDH